MVLENLAVKIFADGADINQIERLNENPLIKGFTTNPTLMKQAGVKDFQQFCRRAANIVYPKPISVEVISDEFEEMNRQARILSEMGQNVFVKIPITNTKGLSSNLLIKDLAQDGVRLNVTAIMTQTHFESILNVLPSDSQVVLSVFAGRIADTGVDPLPLMKNFSGQISNEKGKELLWASTRELFNIVQANDAKCDIVTVPSSILSKLPQFGKSLEIVSLETVRMFHKDAVESGFSIH